MNTGPDRKRHPLLPFIAAAGFVICAETWMFFFKSRQDGSAPLQYLTYVLCASVFLALVWRRSFLAWRLLWLGLPITPVWLFRNWNTSSRGTLIFFVVCGAYYTLLLVRTRGPYKALVNEGNNA